MRRSSSTWCAPTCWPAAIASKPPCRCCATGTAPHLVGVASSVTYLPLPRAEAYGASKAGLRYLFESLRIDLAPEGIEVTVVSPGFVDTPLTAKNDFPMPLSWPVDKAARHIFAKLKNRPLEIALPGAVHGRALAAVENAQPGEAGDRQTHGAQPVHRSRTSREHRHYRQRHLGADQRLPAQSQPRDHPVRGRRPDRRPHPHRGRDGRWPALCRGHRFHRVQRLDLPEFHSPAGPDRRGLQSPPK